MLWVGWAWSGGRQVLPLVLLIVALVVVICRLHRRRDGSSTTTMVYRLDNDSPPESTGSGGGGNIDRGGNIPNHRGLSYGWGDRQGSGSKHAAKSGWVSDSCSLLCSRLLFFSVQLPLNSPLDYTA
jgi:hypothetical protein